MSVYHVASIVGIVLIAILAAAVLVLGVRYIVRIERRITRQAEQIKALEAAQGKRMPGDLKETVENALFALGRYKYETEQTMTYVDNAIGHISKLNDADKRK